MILRRPSRARSLSISAEEHHHGRGKHREHDARHERQDQRQAQYPVEIVVGLVAVFLAIGLRHEDADGYAEGEEDREEEQFGLCRQRHRRHGTLAQRRNHLGVNRCHYGSKQAFQNRRYSYFQYLRLLFVKHRKPFSKCQLLSIFSFSGSSVPFCKYTKKGIIVSQTGRIVCKANRRGGPLGSRAQRNRTSANPCDF